MFEYKLFGNLINCKELANVEFLVGNQCKKLYAHKLILSMRSKFFKQILYPCGWEQSSVQIVQITLSDIAFESFEVILNYLYTNEIALNFDSFWDVILCSQKFQLPKLYQLCLRWFQNRVNETNFICHFLNAYQIKNKDVLDIMFVYFEKNFPHLIQSKKFFNELDLEMFKVFVQKINQIKSSSEMKEIIWIRFIEFIICYFNKSRQCTSKEIVRAIEDLLVTPKFVVNKNLQLVDTELERLISHNFVERVNCPRFSHDDLKVNEKGNECKNENEKQCKNETTGNEINICKFESGEKKIQIQNSLKSNEEKKSLSLISVINLQKRFGTPKKIKVVKIRKKKRHNNKYTNNNRIRLACTILENKSSKNKNQQHTQQQQQQKQQQQQQKPGADLIKDHFSDQSLMSSLKQNTPLRHPIFPNLPVNAQMLKVLLVSTDQLESHLEDVKKSLLVKGNIRYIHTFHACDSTPSYEHLKKYDSVFLFSSINAFQNSKKLGDSLAKFVDNGGGLVMSTYRCLFKRPKKYKGAELKGRIVSKGYLPIKKGVLKDKRSSLGEILIKNHPTMDGIKKFDGGMLSYRIKFNKSHLKSNSNFVSNRELNNLKNQKKCYSIIVAKWSDGNPLIFYNYSPNMKGKIVYLNFWPISGEVYGYKGKYNYWQNKYDGRKIIANAIHFSALKEEVF
ncbi:btb/poz domain-containing protein [Anaeramoeba flamelloides]|uniref:Btb/poz domain-containing protein n=1 Tax=Anaeramoeba flamelloides TaxID=1746091 RepID=A0ABQ8Z872_9EUKA|nr:btb/poz domain-containing protein [Anaeramoeba flamelloides]